MRLFTLLAGIAALTTAAPAFAACEIDANSTLKGKAKAVSDGGWTRDATLAFTNDIVNEASVTLDQLFKALADPACPLVTLPPSERAGVVLKHPTGDAADLFQLLAKSPADAATVSRDLWDGGYDGLRKLALLYHSTPMGKRVVQTVLMRALIFDRDSLGTPPYGKFRQEIRERQDAVVAAKPDARMSAMIGQMMFDCAVMADRFDGNQIPDDAYSYVKPAA